MTGQNTLIPPGWVDCFADELFAPLEDGRTLHQGWSPQCEREPSPDEDTWGVLKTTSIQSGFFISEQNKRLPQHLISRPMLEVRKGDILITCAGPRSRCGVACLVRNTRKRLMISGKMYRFRVLEECVEPRYVEAWLQTHTAQAAIDRMKTGGSDSGLNLTHDRFRRLKMPLAPVKEQQRIVAEIEKQFTRLDAAVGALKRVQANLKRYRAAVLKAAVEGLLVPTEAELARREGRSYEPASELLKRIVAERRARWETRNNRAKKMRLLNEEPLAPEQTNLSGLPEGWSWTSLDALLREPLRNGHSAKESGSSDGVPTFTLSAVTYGDFSAANIKITTANAEKVEDLWVQPDDIFVERSNTPELVGTCRRYVGPPRPAIFPDLLIRVRLVTSAVPAYIELALQAERTQRFFREKAQGISGTMPKIDQGVVEKVAVPLPPIAEQTRIVVEAERRFSIVDELHAEVENDLKRAERLRQAILKSAFEGKLVPQDPSDEPASVLLERIRAERVRRAEELKPSNASLRKPRKKKEVATA